MLVTKKMKKAKKRKKVAGNITAHMRTNFIKAIETPIFFIQMYFFAYHTIWTLIAELWPQWRTIRIWYHQIVHARNTITFRN